MSKRKLWGGREGERLTAAFHVILYGMERDWIDPCFIVSPFVTF